MNLFLGLLVLAGALALIFSLLWWLIITTEGVYLGRTMVIWLYDLYANRYERIKGYMPWMESRFLGRPIMRVLNPNIAPLVLDAATGTGRLPRALVAENTFHGRVVGVDLSRRMLHIGAGRLADAMDRGRVYLMHTPAEKLPFDDDLFDMVTCLEALEFMMRPKQVIAELVRVTRPGGWLLLTNRLGTDAKLMPGKTWSRDRAISIYQDEFGLRQVRFESWQVDYDLVWAQKPGDSLPTRARPLEEIWQCPRCAEKAMILVEGAYVCTNCECRVPLGKDGVIDLIRQQ